VADERTTPPAPRPRRRRTDIDPNAPSPPVANERRRRGTASEGPPDAASLAAASAVEGALLRGSPPSGTDAGRSAADAAAAGAPSDATAPFHVPGLAATVVAAPPTAADADVPALPDPGRAWINRLDDRSLDPNICPFLRASAEGALRAPIEVPDPANRCAALAEAVPQSLRQQELVCLSSGHVNCPRYLRGAAVVVETPAPVVRTGRTLTTPMFASLVLLVMAVSASVAFAMSRGMTLSGAGPGPSASSVAAVPSIAPSASPLVVDSPAAPSTEVPLSPTQSATPSPLVSPTPTPVPTPTPTPKSDRYKLLTACSDAPKCWIYRVRSGDNLYSIAHYFGVSVDSIYARNPWLKNSHLRAGQELRLPPPTR
jgi:LysM repeat protein